MLLRGTTIHSIGASHVQCSSSAGCRQPRLDSGGLRLGELVIEKIQPAFRSYFSFRPPRSYRRSSELVKPSLLIGPFLCRKLESNTITLYRKRPFLASRKRRVYDAPWSFCTYF